VIPGRQRRIRGLSGAAFGAIANKSQLTIIWGDLSEVVQAKRAEPGSVETSLGADERIKVSGAAQLTKGCGNRKGATL
jgi:hypothetical protein